MLFPQEVEFMVNQKQEVRHLSSQAAVIEVNAADNKNSAVSLQKRKEQAAQELYIRRV
jgi:hypothetical protein